MPLDQRICCHQVSGNDAASALVSHGAASLSHGNQPELRTLTRAVGDVVSIPGSAEQTKEWHAKGSSITALATTFISRTSGITIPAIPRLRLMLTR
ncbi:hypothetical protein N7471_003426 [Penicillium samsonianum]|uniref:uncharacterized protein n=1 Tax=Penicillium samsonianum TaxID=1882272 RepID=UPI002548EB39|nr:uncharacterized protein N7471_003426 [Penicillium samsonianum]KAJ6143973.1 hypothetical protein N7471_003426 [Penicillium samsonianum]